MGVAFCLFCFNMSSRCTCCHICHTSLKTSRRSFFPCSACPSIICQQCVEGMNEDWDALATTKDWECPRCRDCCPCKRCKNKDSTDKRRSSASPIHHIQKRQRSESSSPAPKKQKVSNESSAFPNFLKELSQFADDQTEESLVGRLQKKNEECLNYIGRTERLLQIIREEQDRISSELQSLVKKTPTDSPKLLNASISV